MQARLDCRTVAAGLGGQPRGGSQRDVIEAGTGVYHEAMIMSWWCWPGSGQWLHHGMGADPV